MMTTTSTARNLPRLRLICILLGISGLLGYAVSKFTSGMAAVAVTAVGLLGFIVALATLARRQRRFVLIVREVAVALVLVVIGTYLVLFPLIYFFQDTIADRTSAFFQPRSLSAEAARALAADDVEAIELATPDGARLSGWLVRNAAPARSPLLIYFDGSGSETSQMLPYARKLAGWTVALVKYRGFGPSTGTPSQAHAFADATLLFDTLAQRPDIDSRRVVAMGYSLGSGVAVYLSAQRPVTATVLVAPYHRLTLVGLKQPPIYAPLSGIMHRYFDSIGRAPGIAAPLLCLVGTADPVVPPALSLELVSQWGGKAAVKTYDGEDHSLLLHDNSSWADIAGFLGDVR
jgi:hypothetical protein